MRIQKLGLDVSNIDYLCCVTSTAFLLPGLGKILLRRLQRLDCQHVDIVGMGCSAGINGLASTSSWCALNPGKIGVLICCEIASAFYDYDDSAETAIVNSLFGDGVAVAIIGSNCDLEKPTLNVQIEDFQSQLLDVDSNWFRYRWVAERARYSFYLHKKIPKAIAASIDQPIDTLLARHGLQRGDISQWLFHTGGEAILSGIQEKLCLTDDHLENSRHILRQYGNLSSSSILFTLRRALESQTVEADSLGLLVAMGPGPGIEACLVKIGS
jgi:3,5-dihydroxyphenylacetyl-CoA synthase